MLLDTQIRNALREAETFIASDIADDIDRLSKQYDNEDTLLREAAERANRFGLPAYWRSTDFNDAAGGLLAAIANSHGIEVALNCVVDEAWPAGLKTRARLLSTLIPLNSAAVAEKEAAVAASVAREVA